MQVKRESQLSVQLCAVLILSSALLGTAVVEGAGAEAEAGFDEEFVQRYLPEAESVAFENDRLQHEGHFQPPAKETQLHTPPALGKLGSMPSEQLKQQKRHHVPPLDDEMVQKIQSEATVLAKGSAPTTQHAIDKIKHQMASQMASYRVRLSGLQKKMDSTASAIHSHQQIIAAHRARIARLRHSLHKKHTKTHKRVEKKAPVMQLLSSKKLQLGKIINDAVVRAVTAHVTAKAQTQHAEARTRKRGKKTLRQPKMTPRRKAKPAARRFSHYRALTVPGKATLTSKRMMTAIDKATLAIRHAVPAESAAEKQKMRKQIRDEVNAEVATKIAELRALKLPAAKERAEVHKFIKTAVVKAVTAQVADRQRNLEKKNLLTPNNGNKYIVQEATQAAAAAMRAAKAQGKNNQQVRYAAKVASNIAAQVASRQVAQATARTAAMRAAQTQANAGGGHLKQRVAAQIAARAALRFVVHKKRMLRYLAKMKPEVIPQAPNPYAAPTKEGAIAARNAQEARDAVKIAASSHWPKNKANIATRAPTVAAPKKEGTTAKGTKRNKTGAKKVKAGATAKRAGKAKGKAKGKPAAVPYKARLAARAAAIRASAAVARANAAAEAARNAPPGKAGAKIIAKARLIAAEAAKDIADARVADQVAKSGVGPKPIIHQAASQAASIATPIATEVASQSASIQATIAAVKATKKLLRAQQKASAGAIKAAHGAEALADRNLKGTIHKRIRTAVAKAVKTAVKAAIRLGKRGKHLKAVALAAARKAALLAAKQVKAGGLRKEVRRESRAAGHRVAAVAKAAGGNAEQVASLSTQTRSTLRMDGEDAINANVKKALAHARAVALKAASRAMKRVAAKKATKKKQAKAVIKRAINRAAGGSRGASLLLKHAQAKLKRP